MVRLMCWGLAALLAAAIPAPSQEKDAVPLRIEGRLTSQDVRDKTQGRPHKVHQVRLAEGSTYVIEMSSMEMDAVLRLDDSAGKQVAFNDDIDASRNRNSRIVHKAAATGVYHVIATCYDERVGAYTLTVRLGNPDGSVRESIHKLVGKAAPQLSGDFALSGNMLDGNIKQLSDLKGKVVLLDFWAMWSGPSVRAWTHWRQWSSELQADGLEILGVTTYFEKIGFDKSSGQIKKVPPMPVARENETLRAFLQHHQVAHRILAVSPEQWRKAVSDYKVQRIPQVVLIDRQGIVRLVRVEIEPSALLAEVRKLVNEK